jgi:hypothetical protein
MIGRGCSGFGKTWNCTAQARPGSIRSARHPSASENATATRCKGSPAVDMADDRWCNAALAATAFPMSRAATQLRMMFLRKRLRLPP